MPPPHTISQIAKRFVTGGVEAALGRKEQANRHKKIDGRVEAHIIAISCSQAPEGRERWTLQLIADELVRLGVVGSISDTAVMETLKKNELKPWQKKEWCIPKPGAEFVARMEDVLDVYQRPYDPLRPVVCLDETNRQLIEKRSIPPKPGNPEREDYEYRRCGVVDLFVAFEPLACKRVVKLTDTRTAVDFAHFLRELIEVHYSHCEKIVLVMDNLNIHSIASLYKVFDPATARHIARRLEIHYTPIHASWLNMAEIEIGILSRQCLSQSLSSFELMTRQVNAWTLHRNAACSTVHWRFSSCDARCKLRKLYPIIL